jgi:hypothetical protein
VTAPRPPASKLTFVGALFQAVRGQ